MANIESGETPGMLPLEDTMSEKKTMVCIGLFLAGALLVIYAPYRWTDLIGMSCLWLSLRVKP
jgi:hypothetical protein